MFYKYAEKSCVSTRYIEPVRIIANNNCVSTDLLLEGKIRQATRTTKACVIPKGGWVIIDFGVELVGGINITTQSIGGENFGKLRVTFGESVAETMSSIGYKNAGNDHAPRDMEVLVGVMGNIETGSTGFRFVKIECLSKEVHISCLYAALKIRDISYIGDFDCDDKLLNRIWKTGAYTVHLNMQDYIWDGIKRDRLIWGGDLHPEISTILSVFGDNDCILNTFELMRKNFAVSGWLDNIPTYSMWWIKTLYDWYVYTGNKEYLKCIASDIKFTINMICKSIDSEGKYKFENDFVDWNTYGDENKCKAGIYALYNISLKTGVELCDVLKLENEQKICTEALKRISEITFRCDDKQMTALQVLAGMEDAKSMYKNIFSKDLCRGISAFTGFYTLQAIAMADEMTQALNIVRNYWGGMIKMGATTFWEEFCCDDMENSFKIDEFPVPGKRDIHGDFGKECYKGYRKSLCHGWSSGPTAFLSQFVLGVIPVTPKYREFKVNPLLGDLEWAKGKIPTPYGVIEVEHENTANGIKTKVSAPKGLKEIKQKGLIG